MSEENAENKVKQEKNLLYISPQSQGQAVGESGTNLTYLAPPAEVPSMYYGEQRERKGVINSAIDLFKDEPYFILPAVGLVGVIYSLVMSGSALSRKANLDGDTEQKRILTRKFMYRLGLRTKMQIFCIASLFGCMAIHDYRVEQKRQREMDNVQDPWK